MALNWRHCLNIALATPRVATSLDNGLGKVERLMAEASAQQAEIICFPEAYLPGLRGLDFDVPHYDAIEEQRVMREVARLARTHRIAVIMGMEQITKQGRQIVAAVFDAQGELLGRQTKNQLDPSEEPFYVPGDTRQLFTVNGVTFGVAICHEGFRYPETVRWAAMRGAKIVFHPHCTGSDKTGVVLKEWGAVTSPYYEKAIMCRALENTIYFAGVNYAFRYQESATCVIDTSGKCQAFLPYGQEAVLVQKIDVEKATGLLASRLAPERYREV